MHSIIKNIGKSILRVTNSEGKYPPEYMNILEQTTDALRYEFVNAEKFYRYHQNKVNFPHEPKQYIQLIKEYTDKISKEQEQYFGIELYLPFHIGLYLLMRFQKPTIALETGVERGGSTLALLKGLYANTQLLTPCDGCMPSKLYSYDISNSTRFLFAEQEWEKGKEAKIQRKNVKRIYVPIGTLVPEWLKSNWNLIIGDSIKKVPQTLKKVGVIDFFVAGYGHTYDIQKAEVGNIWDSLKSGGILVIDRSDWEGDKYFNEMLSTKDIAHFVVCKESKYSLKFNYVIIIKP